MDHFERTSDHSRIYCHEHAINATCLFHLSTPYDQSRAIIDQISLKNKAPVSPKLVEGRGGREEETTHYITPIIKSIHVTSLEISFTRVPPLEQQRPAGAPSLCTTYIYTYIHTCIYIYIHLYTDKIDTRETKRGRGAIWFNIIR